jgi:uncharacterized NAD(P)/FAD-binding protein YdhS
MTLSIGIIGAGFSGTLLSTHLIKNSKHPLRIFLFNPRESKIGGLAYSTKMDFQLLNVTAAKMSAYPESPDHFLNWVMQQPEFSNLDRSMVAQAFLPRYLYGKYLVNIWAESMDLARKKGIEVIEVNEQVTSLNEQNGHYTLHTSDGELFEVKICVLATGNELPKTPEPLRPLENDINRYVTDPWRISSLENIEKLHSILIVGNGLTMVDTVIGLHNKGFKGVIHAISPNGFNILPHRHNGLQYKKIMDDVGTQPTLKELVAIVKKHIRIVRNFGLSAEPVIDALRPSVQEIWRQWSEKDRAEFLKRFRHLWGVARHRIPLHIHDRIQQMRIDGSLFIIAGHIEHVDANDNQIGIRYLNRKTRKTENLDVDRIINCTGPNSDLRLTRSELLKQLYQNGIIEQDKLRLGLSVDTPTYRIKRKDGEMNPNFYAIGTHLKGELWESTAVNELRVQAAQLADIILNHG